MLSESILFSIESRLSLKELKELNQINFFNACIIMNHSLPYAGRQLFRSQCKLNAFQLRTRVGEERQLVYQTNTTDVCFYNNNILNTLHT